MKPKTVLKKLLLDLSVEEDQPWKSWNPDSLKPPNSEWLTDVYDYLAETKEPSIQDDESDFGILAIVPDQFRHLWQPGCLGTPLLPPAKGEKALDAALRTIGVPLVSGSDSLLFSIRRFVSIYPELDKSGSAICDLTEASGVVDTMVELASEWQDCAGRWDEAAIQTILDFLSRDESVRELDRDRITIKKLKGIADLPYARGQVYLARR